jgi:hypothetical protein
MMDVTPATFLSFSSPTAKYIEPGDDSLNSKANEKDAENEPFENG